MGRLLLLLFLLAPNQLRQHAGKLCLTVLGVALGSAAYTAIQVANDGVLRSLEETGGILGQRIDWVVQAAPADLISGNVVARIAQHPAVENVFPFIEQFVVASGVRDPVRIVGVDTISLSGVVRQQRESASTTGALGFSRALRGTIEVIINSERVPIVVEALSEEGVAAGVGESDIVVDLALFSRLLRSGGGVTKVGVSLRQGFDHSSALALIDSIVPRGAWRSTLRDGRMARISQAFRLNIQFVGALGIVIAAFLVFNSFSFILYRRKAELEVLRMIGASRRLVAAILLGEIATIVCAASLLGVAAGSLGGEFLVGHLAKTVSALYAPVTESTANHFSLLGALCAFGTCAAVGIIGALLPILRIARLYSPPQYSPRQSAVVGAGCIALGATLAYGMGRSEGYYAGFLPPVLLVVGSALMVPLYVRIIPAVFGVPLLRRNASGLLLRSGWMAYPHRIRPTIAALGIAISLLVATDSMVGSFRVSVSRWLSQLLDADLYVSAAENVNGVSSTGLSAALIESLHTDPRVVAFDDVFSTSIPTERGQVTVTSVDFDLLVKNQRVPLLSVESELLADQQAVLLSESYVNTYGRSVQPLVHHLGERKVAGVFKDYSSEHGLIYLATSEFRKIFPEVRQQSMAVYLKEGVNAQEYKSALREGHANLVFSSFTRGELMTEVFSIFDRTFVLTYALQIIAMVISLFVILTTVVMLAIERGRQLATLYAIGMSTAQQRMFFVMESVVIGAAGALFGLFQGITLSLVLVFFVNRYFFGWTIDYSFSYWSTALFFLLFLTLVGGLSLVVWRRCRTDVSELRYD